MTSATSPVQVDIEYCLVCDFKSKCEELKEFIQAAAPDSDVSCRKGSRGTFEVKINQQLVYSKLKQGTFPEFSDVTDNVLSAARNQPMKRIRATKDECTII